MVSQTLGTRIQPAKELLPAPCETVSNPSQMPAARRDPAPKSDESEVYEVVVQRGFEKIRRSTHR
jgi:hypothetical protein